MCTRLTKRVNARAPVPSSALPRTQVRAPVRMEGTSYATLSAVESSNVTAGTRHRSADHRRSSASVHVVVTQYLTRGASTSPGAKVAFMIKRR